MAKTRAERKAAKDFVTKLCHYPKTNRRPRRTSRSRETEQAIVEARGIS
jgi:hypothetical protein